MFCILLEINIIFHFKQAGGNALHSLYLLTDFSVRIRLSVMCPLILNKKLLFFCVGLCLVFT